ncbi:NADP-dependent oxidoreductase domain protein [Kalmanozyma brasiliensis GHG001]|uniref:NADP-dependent oxidoreductase domain-containing protein n=1 Tax=Kalmanozyma brasiliensis (strain GHG001) TaxID=1365824 RepID=V5ETW8_KALBG|nr:NADP-dependent oxidoreductase domain protein [Kalmanozyma brasiliensis GHG001]EST05509.1 NADP-dependent oxidoreductase domain protein [Kalmanozyma brasiliensis GHG001]
MPKYPSVEPSNSDFPQQPALESLVEDELKGGLAPWRTNAINDPSNLAKGAGDLAADASPLVFGGGVFGVDMYNTSETLASDLPLRTVRLALRYGINAFDTSPYYFPSEFTLGNILRRLEPEFPRESYYIITKCGRYGPDKGDFDYSAAKIDSSVRGSCRRLGTNYLDVALTHDAEFVCDQVGRSHDAGWESGIVSGLVEPSRVGVNQTREQVIESLGLAPGLEAASKVHGKGDEQFLEAVRTLFKLKDEGVIKRVGISGYPLPVLLRLSRLVATSAPYRSLDVVLNYSNHCLHSSVLEGWKDLFAADPRGGADAASLKDLAWKAPLLMNGSPFSMGLLTDGTPPSWHPASAALQAATKEASQTLLAQGSSLTMTALTYGFRGSELPHPSGQGPQLRTLVGLSNPDHVHSTIEAYRILAAGATEAGKVLYPLKEDREAKLEAYKKQTRSEQVARDLFAQRGVREWSWSSGL